MIYLGLNSSLPAPFFMFLLAVGYGLVVTLANLAAPSRGGRSPRLLNTHPMVGYPVAAIGPALLLLFKDKLHIDLGEIVLAAVLMFVGCAWMLDRQRDFSLLPPNTSGGTPVVSTMRERVLAVLLCILVVGLVAWLFVSYT